MSTRQADDTSPTVTSKEQLIQWVASGEKPQSGWLIGTEHEKFVFHKKTLGPVAYAGDTGILALMQALIAREGWQPVLEGETIIALKRPGKDHIETISLEPGGQFELSGAPLPTLHDTWTETHEHLRQVLSVGERLGLGFLGAGFAPSWKLAQVPRMPKQRYQVMTGYMPKVGAHGLDMMYRTCTIQVNLDFSSEADMVKKMRVSLALQPIATALFASSPFKEGRLNGFKSMRSEVWRDTDRARTGMLPWAFEDGMGYERYVDYALDVPMYFVYRDGRYIDVAGASFRKFLSGELPQLPGETPTLSDWSDHVTTLFPEVRLKKFLEMRGADSGSEPFITALSAFWVGLLYDDAALEAAYRLIAPWTADERQGLRNAVPAQGLAAPFRGTTALEIARAALQISHQGLKARDRRNAKGDTEVIYLRPLDAIAASGRTMADDLIERFQGPWGNNAARMFAEEAY